MRLLHIVLKAMLLALVGCFVPIGAHAHTPYIGEECQTTMPDGKPARVVLHYGDGIIGPDPSEPLVLDQDNSVVAIGPVTRNYYLLICADYIENVVVYDPHERTIVQPSVSEFSIWPARFQNPREWYPGYRKLPDRGFAVTGATLQQAVVHEIKGTLIDHWAFALAGSFWFAAIWLLVLLPWRLPGVMMENNLSWLNAAGFVYGLLRRIGPFAILMALSMFMNLAFGDITVAFFIAMLLFGLFIAGGFVFALLYRRSVPFIEIS